MGASKLNGSVEGKDNYQLRAHDADKSPTQWDQLSTLQRSSEIVRVRSSRRQIVCPVPWDSVIPLQTTFVMTPSSLLDRLMRMHSNHLQTNAQALSAPVGRRYSSEPIVLAVVEIGPTCASTVGRRDRFGENGAHSWPPTGTVSASVACSSSTIDCASRRTRTDQ